MHSDIGIDAESFSPMPVLIFSERRARRHVWLHKIWLWFGKLIGELNVTLQKLMYKTHLLVWPGGKLQLSNITSVIFLFGRRNIISEAVKYVLKNY